MMHRLFVAIALFSALVCLRAEDMSWPQTLAIVDSFEGSVLLNDAPAKKRESFPAAGTRLTTGPNSYATLVFSNGLALYCGPFSQIEIHKAEQSEYMDTFSGAEFENCSSDIVIELKDGSFGFFQPEPDPTSTLELRTRFGKVEGDGTRFAILLSGTEPIAATLKGNLYYLPERGSRRFIAEGESLDLREASLDNAPSALEDLQSRGYLKFQPIIEPAVKSGMRTVFLVGDSEPAFHTAIQPLSLQGAAFNDYRLATE